MVQSEAAERFLAAPLLADIDRDAQLAVLGGLVETRAPAGAILLEQGKANDYLSFMISGTAAVERDLPELGKDILATLNAPAIFGTTSFFRAAPPTFSIRATSDVWLLRLDHAAHARLRADHPRAAEALALAALRVLSERFDLLEHRLSEQIRAHQDDHPKTTEWSGFRARLFEEPSL
jgi:CRP-like cAMP-binding protein